MLTASICLSRGSHGQLDALSHLTVLSLLRLPFYLCSKPFWPPSSPLAWCPSSQSWFFFTDPCPSFFTGLVSTGQGASNILDANFAINPLSYLVIVLLLVQKWPSLSFLFTVGYCITGTYFLYPQFGNTGVVYFLFQHASCISRFHCQLSSPLRFLNIKARHSSRF